MRSLFATFVAALALPAVLGTGCSSKNSIQSSTDGGTGTPGTCGAATDIAKDDYCTSCTFDAQANPKECKTPRTLNACCVWVTPPTNDVKRGIGLHYFSSSDPNVNVSCLDSAPAQGAPQTVTLQGYVKLFSSGNDSAGVKVEVFKEGANGALGDLIGTAIVTSNDDAKNPPLNPKPEWLKKCPSGGCIFRSYKYEGIPTETRLIIKTSDATANGLNWSDVYDYNIYFANSAVSNGAVTYDVTAAASTDINTVASAAGGFTIRPDKGVLAGEVHDCGDVRLSGVTVDTDLPHEADIFYFGDNEADPLPDKTRTKEGTSTLGLFGALNLPTGTPVKVSAVGKVGGQLTLIGTQVVQFYPGAVTAFSFRGRRPWQK